MKGIDMSLLGNEKDPKIRTEDMAQGLSNCNYTTNALISKVVVEEPS